MTTSPALDAWHRIAADRDPTGLTDLIADDAVFCSPAVHTPQEGKALTIAYLTAAIHVLGPSLTYHRTWHGEDSAVLEFTAELDGKQVHGVDVIGWNDDGRIDSFTVMVRPLKGLHVVIEHMAAELGRLATDDSRST